MKITFVSSSLGCGGAERVVCSLSEDLLRRNHDVSVVTLSTLEADFFSLPSNANRIALDIVAETRAASLVRRSAVTLRKLGILRRAVLSTQPDVVISSLQHINVLTLIALAGADCPVVVTEHLDPTMISCRKPWDQLRRITYPQAARLVSVSEGINKHFGWLPSSKRSVIHNPLPNFQTPGDESDLPAVLGTRPHWVVAMGRLTRQKGFDLLLPAFAAALSRNPNWGLMILGDGDQRPELEQLIEQLGLRDHAFLQAPLRNPFAVLRRAKLFVLPSRHEGFGNVLIEAMACGLPVIATTCPSGPNEIVHHEKDGLLIPPEDVPALAAALDRLMASETDRIRLALCGATAVRRFDMENIGGAWEKILVSIRSLRNRRASGDNRRTAPAL